MEAYDPEDPVTKRVNAFGKRFRYSRVKLPKRFIETVIDAAYPKPTDLFLLGRSIGKEGVIAQMCVVNRSFQSLNITNLSKWWTTFVVAWSPFVKNYGPLPEEMWEIVEQTLLE